MTGRPLRSVLLQDRGPLVMVRIRLSEEHEHYRRSRGEEVPEPLGFRALVDTGASATVLLPGTFARLGAQPTASSSVQTAGGRKERRPTYVGRLCFRGIAGDVEIVARAIEMPGLSGEVEAIVGRDTLGHGRLLYEGREGECALVLRGMEVPLLDLAGPA